MDNNSQNEVNTNGNQSISQSEETFKALAMKAFTSDQYRPTEKQVDKMFQLQEKAMDYTHKERTQVLPQHKFDRLVEFTMFLISIIFLGIIFIFVILKKPEYTDLVITSIVAFIGGYGLGNTKFLKSRNNITEDSI
jgi:hypothetical protein